MKTSAVLIAIVVGLHCAALGALFFVQGCGTTARTGTPPPAVTPPEMPPISGEAVTYPPKPVEKSTLPSAGTLLPAAPETTEYIVRSGDTLSGIARQYGISQRDIADLNKISDPNKLRSGQKLMLPGRLKIKAAPAKPAAKAKAVTSASGAAPSSPAAPAAGREYVVEKGDCLSVIAQKCGTKVKALREVNKLKSDVLHVGQKLIIPEAAVAPAAAPDAAAPAAAALPAASSVEAPAPVAPPDSAAAQTVAPAPPAAPAISAADSKITHIVQQIDGKTEDLDSIAKLYLVTVDEIVELNQLGANRTVTVGQRLIIP